MQPQTAPSTSGQYFKALTIICYALAGGVILFAIIITSLLLSTHSYGNPALIGNDPMLRIIFTVVALFISAAGITASIVLYNKKVAAAKTNSSLKAILDEYRAAVIFRYALMEGPAIFATIALYLTGQFYLLALISVVVALMLYSLPNKQKIIDTLELSSQQAGIINDPDALIE